MDGRAQGSVAGAGEKFGEWKKHLKDLQERLK